MRFIIWGTGETAYGEADDAAEAERVLRAARATDPAADVYVFEDAPPSSKKSVGG